MKELNELENKQDVFDYVVYNLLKQNMASYSEKEEQCAYRGDNNLKCAAGWVIADSEYKECFEGNTVFYSDHPIEINVNNISTQPPEVEKVQEAIKTSLTNYKEDHYDLFILLKKLQSIHDNHPTDEWAYLFKSLAKKQNLTYNEELYEQN